MPPVLPPAVEPPPVVPPAVLPPAVEPPVVEPPPVEPLVAPPMSPEPLVEPEPEVLIPPPPDASMVEVLVESMLVLLDSPPEPDAPLSVVEVVLLSHAPSDAAPRASAAMNKEGFLVNFMVKE